MYKVSHGAIYHAFFKKCQACNKILPFYVLYNWHKRFNCNDYKASVEFQNKCVLREEFKE